MRPALTHTAKPRPNLHIVNRARPVLVDPPAAKPAVPTGHSLVTEAEILEGLEKDEFEPYFQPKIDVKSLTVIGAEALARWRHPRQGIIRPSAFVGTLESAGSIDVLSRCILTKSARFCRALNDAGHSTNIAVNLSLGSLGSSRIVSLITAAVAAQKLDPRHIVLDVTHASPTPDIGSAIENLARLRMKGFGLAIDPYSDGYASMQRLTLIPFSELKIDQFFVTYAGRHDAAKMILASSIAMARALNIQSAAESVETAANWALLVELGCDTAQGYHLAKPMSAHQYLQWLRGWPHKPADVALV